MSDCVFCEIVADRLPRSVIVEDDLTLAFMDTHQFRPGRVVVVPKEHRTDLREFDDALDAAVMHAIRRVALAVSAAFAPDGLTIKHNIGEAGGQDVFHAHFHVFPRYENDGLFPVPSFPAETPARDELDRMASLIRTQLQAS